MRRRGNEMVLESPRAGALFKICNPKIATAIATLSTPQQLKRLRRQDGFPGIELLALLVDCQILFKIDAGRRQRAPTGRGRRPPRSLGLSRSPVPRAQHGRPARQPAGRTLSIRGCHASATGGAAPLARKEDRFAQVLGRAFGGVSPAARLLRERHSTRSFDDQRPITLAELSRFLDNTRACLVELEKQDRLGDGGPLVAYAARPYPSAGASYGLELYLAVDKCEGLARGFYHYDAGGHALVPIGAPAHELEALLAGAKFAMEAPAVPQILITIAARFGRISWKYSSLAYALILKDVGVLTQTLYLMATDMGLGGCAVGSTNIDLFAKMTGIEFHVEGPVGQFALGRPAKSGVSELEHVVLR